MATRAGLCLAAAVLCSAAGCGYMGGPMPPLVNVPAKVVNLNVVQRGDKLIVQFAVPTKTTEGQPLNPPVTLDLRIGERHAAAPVVKDGIARYEIACAEWTGKDAAIEVRVTGANGKDSGWSTPLTIPVVPPPDVPHEIVAESAAAGVRLTWKSTGSHFRVLRMAGTEKDYRQVAPDVAQHEWVDTAVEFGKPHSYLVQTFVPLPGGRAAESDLPEAVSIVPRAPLPGVPTGLRAVPGTASIELSWEGPEGAAPAGYHIYRAIGNGEFVKIGETGAVPTYSDRTAEAGKVYRYAVSGVDETGREGPRSAAVEVTL